MKKILVIMIMVLLCSTAVMGQTKKRSTKKQTNRVRTESGFEKSQREAKEFIDFQKTMCLLYYGEHKNIDRLKIELAKENATKDFSITKFGVDTVYGNGIEYFINVKRDGTIDTLSSHNWNLEVDIAKRYLDDKHDAIQREMEMERKYQQLKTENDAAIAKAKSERKKAEKELKKLSFSWVYDYTYFGKKKVGVKWDYCPESNEGFEIDEMLSKLSLWVSKETGDFYEFSTEKKGKKYTTVEVHFINGMTKNIDVYKNGGKKSIKKKNNNTKVVVANLSGSVKGQFGYEVTAAHVTATNDITGKIYFATTDCYGCFNIEKIPVEGTYTITINKYGYENVEFKNITLESKKKNHLDVQMTSKYF